jgi:hypothetical protein
MAIFGLTALNYPIFIGLLSKFLPVNNFILFRSILIFFWPLLEMSCQLGGNILKEKILTYLEEGRIKNKFSGDNLR